MLRRRAPSSREAAGPGPGQQSTPAAADEVADAALCIVGAGYAGLSALAAAVDYLAPSDRVVIIDKNATWGGQFIEQYGFVKLHQPYEAFTPGAAEWALRKPPGYLASQKEILCHLEDVAGVCASRVRLTTLFGYAYEGHASVNGAVELTARATDGPSVRIRATRLISALGFDIPLLAPLRVTSPEVRSVSVRDARLVSSAMAYDASPVYIVGGGKTGMDLAHQLATSARHGAKPRKIVMLAGSGMWFINRDQTFPVGGRRWSAGRAGFYDLVLELLIGCATGRRDVDSFRAAAGHGALHSLTPEWATKCRAGILSEKELRTVQEGLSGILEGHFVDVEPGPAGGAPVLVYRNGDREEVRLEVDAGAWVVNCTSHLVRSSYEPVLSGDGLVLSTQSGLIFSGPSAFLLTHVFYRRGTASALWARLRVLRPNDIFHSHGASAGVYNLVCICLELPPWITLRCKAIFTMFFWHASYLNFLFLLRFAARFLPYAKRFLTAVDKEIPTYRS